MIVDVPHPLSGGMRLVACPIKQTERPAAIASATPTLGQHTDEVLASLASVEGANPADA
jgi:crotonobetainyl-CoA:carnitine CoA-transferase CaiB-like acyl-CoA transferase